MITHPPGFTVLSTPVALCDRRALSEAWYSALHLHGASRPAVPPRGAPAFATAASNARRAGTARAREFAQPVATMAVRVGAALALPGSPANDRRLTRTKLAEKIERAFVAPKVPPKHASFALDGQRGRVQILLRQTGNQMQIVALCPHNARDVVARALCQARYALAMRGIALCAEVRGFMRS